MFHRDFNNRSGTLHYWARVEDGAQTHNRQCSTLCGETDTDNSIHQRCINNTFDLFRDNACGKQCIIALIDPIGLYHTSKGSVSPSR